MFPCITTDFAKAFSFWFVRHYKDKLICNEAVKLAIDIQGEENDSCLISEWTADVMGNWEKGSHIMDRYEVYVPGYTVEIGGECLLK